MATKDHTKIPTHVVIIMDGNGKWATGRSLPRVMGHNAGMKAMKEIVKKSSEIGVEYLTVYAFSTENWKRSREEVGGIFKLLVKYVDSELKELNKNNVKVNILGDWSKLPEAARDRLKKTLDLTENNDGLKFNIALNYGSREEIRQAVSDIATEVKEGSLDINEISEELISASLYTGRMGIPDPDLMIRTSGEVRISNYLLWQMAYTEMVFTDVLWPDFTPEIFMDIINEFGTRERRYGGRK
mgnify:FL=1